MTYPPYHTTLAHLTKDNWRSHAAAKKQSTYSKIPSEWLLSDSQSYDDKDKLPNVLNVPRECGILTERELEITEIDEVAVLAERLRNKRYTAKEVTTAFCKRAAIAHQLTNCLTEIFFDRALAVAESLDAHLASHGTPIGPLHGVPISLKDQFDIKGMELTMGYASYLGRISPENASLVTLLEKMGAVLYVRTNIPQTLMIGDTFNHVFGRTDNPNNRHLSPGGSSGGEGALVALKGSICGVGTDIGGSVRIPSSFCGLHTVRPSTRRIPYGKATNSGLGQESILSVAGPMCRSFSSVRDFIKIVLDANPAEYDSGALPFKYDLEKEEAVLKRGDKLRIGYAKDDGVVHVTPPMKRALDETVEALKLAGHEVVDFDLAQFKRISELAGEIWSADGGQEYRDVLGTIEEPLIPGILGGGKSSSAYELYSMNREKEALQQSFLSYWLSTSATDNGARPIDALLVAPAPITACIPGQNEWVGYTSTFNVLDTPATVFPVTRVDKTKDTWENIHGATPLPYGDLDKKFIERYDPNLTHGMPVGIQLVGRRWQEETLLAVSTRVEEAVQTYRRKTQSDAYKL